MSFEGAVCHIEINRPQWKNAITMDCYQTMADAIDAADANEAVRSLSTNAFKSVIDIDLLGTFHVMDGAYPYLRKPGCSVINISAPQAYLPLEAQPHVCAAMAGVDMITRTLSMEWGPDGIRINSVVSGPINETEGMDRLAPTPELRDMTIQSVPLKRIGYKSDIANTCMFLGSDLATGISGVGLPVDGSYKRLGVFV